MIKKIFRLWDKHTTACCRVMFVLLIPSVIIEVFSRIYCVLLLMMWLILKTGYEKKWDKDGEERDSGGKTD